MHSKAATTLINRYNAKATAISTRYERLEAQAGDNPTDALSERLGDLQEAQDALTDAAEAIRIAEDHV